MFSWFKNIFAKKIDNSFFFIHIPKTAGTSFINILDGCVAEKEIFPPQLWQEINQDIIAKKSQYKLLRGHFGGGSHKLLSNHSSHRLTILRHPVNLSISTYHFIKREKNTAVYDLVTDRKMGLREFLEEPLTVRKINNRMVRHLSFDLQQDPEAQELFLSTESIKVVSNWIKTPKKIDNKTRLIRAKKAIDACSWFGITERFDESMQLFAFTFNRPPIGKTPRLNAYRPSKDIDNYCQNLIDQQNKYDLELYKYAQIKFEQNYRNMCRQLGNPDIENIDNTLDKYYQKHHTYKITDGTDYDFSMNLLGSSWHRRELTQPDNSFFRWTSSRQAYIDFWVQPQEYQLSIRIINTVSDQHLTELDIHINNISIPYEYDQNEGPVRVLSARIAKSIFKNNLLRIHFNHPETLQHAQVFNSDDERCLGIAINWIRLSPCQTLIQAKQQLNQ